MKRIIVISALALATAGLGCGDDESADNNGGTNVSTNNTQANNTQANNTQANNSLPDRFTFTFENESGDEMLPDFSGRSIIAGNPENLNFTVSFSTPEDQLVNLGLQKDQGPLDPGTYDLSSFLFVWGEDDDESATCTRTNLGDNPVQITIVTADPLDGSLAGQIVCRAGTPEEFTADVSATFAE